MSNLAHRSGNIQSSAGDARASWTVTAYEVGAQVATAATTRTITVRSGHGFAAADQFIIGTDATTYRTVDSVTATTVVIPGGEATVTVVVGDLLTNLGADTGTTAPNYDGSGVTIYSDMDGTTAVTESRLTTDSDGEFQYWHSTAEIWELVRDGDGTPQQVITDSVVGDVIAPASSTDNAIARFSGTTGKVLQDYTSGTPTISDTGSVALGGDAILTPGTATGATANTSYDDLVVDSTGARGISVLSTTLGALAFGDAAGVIQGLLSYTHATDLLQLSAANTILITLDGAGVGTLRLEAGVIVQFGTSTPATIRVGSGDPESAITANPGSLYLRTSGGAGTTLYVKESGTGNTGWIAK